MASRAEWALRVATVFALMLVAALMVGCAWLGTSKFPGYVAAALVVAAIFGFLVVGLLASKEKAGVPNKEERLVRPETVLRGGALMALVLFLAWELTLFGGLAGDESLVGKAAEAVKAQADAAPSVVTAMTRVVGGTVEVATASNPARPAATVALAAVLGLTAVIIVTLLAIRGVVREEW